MLSSCAADCLIASSSEKKDARSAQLRTFKKQFSTMARAHANQEPRQTLGSHLELGSGRLLFYRSKVVRPAKIGAQHEEWFEGAPILPCQE